MAPTTKENYKVPDRDSFFKECGLTVPRNSPHMPLEKSIKTQLGPRLSKRYLEYMQSIDKYLRRFQEFKDSDPLNHFRTYLYCLENTVPEHYYELDTLVSQTAVPKLRKAIIHDCLIQLSKHSANSLLFKNMAIEIGRAHV